MKPSANTADFIWHPFTQMKAADPPLHIEKGKGAMLYGANHKTYIDAISSWWVNLHGHANPYIGKRIAQQAAILEQVVFAGCTHTPAITLAKDLLAILPSHFSKVFFTDDGSTSVEAALKMAIQFWYNMGKAHKTKIIAFENAYHGDTFGAMAVGARGGFNAPFHRHLFDVIHIPTPNKENIDELLIHFSQLIAAGDIAAFIFEPLVQGAAGMLMYEARYLDELLMLAKEKEVVSIADEVMTGFGRTGKNFATGYLTHQPDIICLSKGITGGFLPLGVTVCSQPLYDAFYADSFDKTFLHGHSYTANPLACVAATASLQLLLEERCRKQLSNIEAQHKTYAAGVVQHKFVRRARYTGTILAIELNTKGGSSYFNAIREEAYRFYIRHGVLLRPLGNVVYVMPPYCITKEELTKIYKVITQSLSYLQHI